MRIRWWTQVIFAMILGSLCLSSLVYATDNHQDGLNDLNAGEFEITEGEFSAVGEFSTTPKTGAKLSLEPNIFPPSNLARQDYQAVYDAATLLLNQATQFRTNELQLGTTVSCKDKTGIELQSCLKQNYKDFNGGRLFYRFCASFEPQSATTPQTEINLSGSCRAWFVLSPQEQQQRVADSATKALEQPFDVRNMLLLARQYFGFLSLGPLEQVIDQGNVHVIGRLGVLSATREIANIHLIFGQEFMVDATDYRFSSGANPSAEAIINEEIQQLSAALQQFQAAVDVLAFAFNTDFGGPAGKRIGDFFGNNEYDLFNTVSERMIDTLSELALRYRQLGQDQKALEIYTKAFNDQYIQSLAIAESARKNNSSFLLNGGWRLMNNLEHLRARAQTITGGVNPFGFKAEYVPLQPYADLMNTTRGSDGKAGLYRDAQEDENEAKGAQREFDQNRTALNSELQNLRLTYDAKLAEICGASSDYTTTCVGGLMERNYFDMAAAINEINLAYDAMQQIPAQIEIEQEKAGKVINLILEGGRKLSALEHARALVNMVSETDILVDSSSNEQYGGTELRGSTSFGIQIPAWQASVSLSAFAGLRWSWTQTSSTQKVINYDAIELGELNSLQAIEQATTQASIEIANRDAIVKGLLLQQVSKLIQYDLELNRYNQLAAEHNNLVEQYHMWLNLRELAQEDLVDSYLNNPAYRILRDHWTVEASRSFNLAAQFAYFTAKAAEYDLLEPFPDLNQIFKARTADDLDNFLLNLDTWYQGKLTPGALNRFPYRISVTCDILHLYGGTLSSDPKQCKQQSPDVRYAEFQKFLQQHLLKDSSGKIIGAEFSFTTSLVDNNIFTQSIWNNRIAGVGLPLQRSNGLAINLYLRQFGNVGAPEVILTHAGHTTYRKNNGELVYYSPNPAQPLGAKTPDTLKPKSTTGVVLTTLNGDFTNTGEPTNAFINLSVAASNWTIKIDLTSPRNVNLDLSQIEDIEIIMDTTGIARPGLEQQVLVDAAKLQGEYDSFVVQ